MIELALAIIVMTGVTYLLRAVPLVLVRKDIETPWINSFLYYVPYAVLTAMTVPAIIWATSTWVSGLGALIVAVILALTGRSLMTVAVGAAMGVLVIEGLLALAA